jgi:hypothetical protein
VGCGEPPAIGLWKEDELWLIVAKYEVVVKSAPSISVANRQESASVAGYNHASRVTSTAMRGQGARFEIGAPRHAIE